MASAAPGAAAGHEVDDDDDNLSVGSEHTVTITRTPAAAASRSMAAGSGAFTPGGAVAGVGSSSRLSQGARTGMLEGTNGSVFASSAPVISFESFEKVVLFVSLAFPAVIFPSSIH